MNLQRNTRPTRALETAQPRTTRARVRSVTLFIIATVIASMTCILYLWQQSQIVTTSQEIASLDNQYIAIQQQRADLLAQVQDLQSTTRVIAQATKYGMVLGDPRDFKQVTVTTQNRPVTVAQAPSSDQQSSSVLLPATNAAITSWWQGAWNGLYGLVQ